MTEGITIDCGERLSIEHAEELLHQLEKSLQESADIVLDGSRIQYCDTAGLQLICALQKSLSKTDHTIQWQGTSSVLLETAGYLGLTSALNLSEPSLQH
ncbi:STAS domain-containing protein [Thalassolituus sp. LLYu03]|uniref:STAS domain-containing protein n=1 Tax=Thalassolituus sp. LLYu03 TaxID=3421656 RepID=UPI003D2B5360